MTQSAEAHLTGDRYGNGTVPYLSAISMKGHAERSLNLGCQLWTCISCMCVDTFSPEKWVMGHFTHEMVKYGADVMQP